MTASKSDSQRAAFAARLNQVLDQAGWPGELASRAERLCAPFNLSPSAAKKWLTGQGFPNLATMIALADHLHTDFAWLATGQHSPNSQHAATPANMELVPTAISALLTASNLSLLRRVAALTTEQRQGLEQYIGRLLDDQERQWQQWLQTRGG